jgi:GntR family transcriptional regulator
MTTLPLEPASTLQHVPGISLHRQLYLVLRDRILRGVWPQGGALPKEEALCEQFGVSRITVRRALADLAAQGLIDRRHGRGSFVREHLRTPRADATLNLLEGLQQSAKETQVRVLAVQHATAPLDIARLLQIADGETAVHALRLRSIHETPVQLTDAWVPAAFGHKVTATALKKQALYEILLAQGVSFGRTIQDISCEAADPQRARLLKTEAGAPLLKLTRLVHDLNEMPVQHITAYMSPERSRILMDIPGASINTLSAGQIVHDV